ncbi:hypothetical protein [Anoxybacter fermentans]|uniref:hypothetical protein n=1 Tax=Anoxybacter fermentans TaxID=1323375 RepID=UPI0013E0D838|nr:hypothetical protein [Anoxybacter fermentans]
MANELWKRLEQQFFRYAEMYDNNILAIARERNLQVAESTLKEILDEAKHRTV